MHSITVESFLDYIQAFNARDYQNQHAFYAPDVELILPEERIAPLQGSKAIMNHYQPLHEDFEEVLVPIDVLVNDHRVFFLMEAIFRAKQPVTNGVEGFDYKKGDIIRVTVWALYEMENGKMRRIYTNLWKREFFGSKFTLEDRIKDSQTRAVPSMVLK